MKQQKKSYPQYGYAKRNEFIDGNLCVLNYEAIQLLEDNGCCLPSEHLIRQTEELLAAIKKESNLSRKESA
jgi:hypothetical protein